MTTSTNLRDAVAEMRRVRQIRQYRPDPVPDDLVQELLQVARWTGSSRNTQPWEFILIDDPDVLRQISQLRGPINWLANAPLAIGIVLAGESDISEAYDEGRLTERIMIAAHFLGLGAGTAWFGNAEQEAAGKRILGIPVERTARSVVAVGYAITHRDPRPNPAQPGRRPLAELLHYNRYGQRERSQATGQA